MSVYTYAGEYKNPTAGWYVVENAEGGFEIWVRTDRKSDGSAEADHKHTSAPTFDDQDDADDYINGCGEFFERDYDDYLEENRFELAQQERYEAFRNEY